MSESHGRVLVVDDARLNRMLLSAHVKEAGHEVECADDGEEALRMLREGTFDVVLLDLLMPKMSGYDVLRTITQDEQLRHIPVIVVSSVEETDSVVHCLEMGAADYISKPFNPVLVKARLNASLLRKRMRDTEERYLEELQKEKRRTDEVLYNILPRAIAERLKRGEREIVDYCPDVTVMFADLVGFTTFSAHHPPASVLQTLNALFSAFDVLMERHQAEKIKTIGDEYMVVAGVPVYSDDHALIVTRIALEMMEELEILNSTLTQPMALRVGIHSGPVIAGVIGSRRFAYDLWGDTVNTAHRVQSSGEAGQIVVSEATHRKLRGVFKTESRGSTQLRGRDPLETFVVHRRSS